ncbi:uncharacterized protein LOC114528829 [Dendronephthya gigantea]|uniref:uncharacterized protein LOC114528829 n=1 Tax=Dendronephthya gigantea TaxID=151771 RepID=UPI00106ADA23|nr:uncharacterized protein LOC114528829 [Dendronephthya gigantea]XP_028406345.1 uncharacterized protein LOC114528829 [Dendronephthya gigantea]
MFAQVLQSTAKGNDVEESTKKKQTPLITSVSSDFVGQSEKSVTVQENKESISVLKKVGKKAKKTVHFPENVVSVKFYDISDDDESDDDTLILSDHEEDDLQDQEVPFNTYDDYTTHHLSSFTTNFTPHFSFPPALDVSNLNRCDNLDEDQQRQDQQLTAIMNDDDGRQSGDPAIHEDEDNLSYIQNTERFQGELLVSAEANVMSEILNPEPTPDDTSLGDSVNPIDEKWPSVNPTVGEFQGFDTCRDDQLISTEAKEVPGNSDVETNIEAVMTKSGREDFGVSCEVMDDHLTTVKDLSRLPDDDVKKMEVETTNYGMSGIIQDDLNVNSIGSTHDTSKNNSLAVEQMLPVEVKSLVENPDGGNERELLGDGLESDYDENMKKTTQSESLMVEDITSNGKTGNRGIESSVRTGKTR